VADLEYPDVETIVVDDGSTDPTATIASTFGVRLIQTENQGLSAARNTGLSAATGEVVAFLDDDAVPDVDWLRHMVAALLDGEHAAVGGPNIPPPNGGRVSQAIAQAPGGPIHVLLSDRIAEHIPGCNMAFWKEALDAVEGFDPQFHAAGDDVDICWRLQERGWTLGFCPAAMVWHRRRGKVRSYLKQQYGYGRAEALLERKWPERYNRAGHVSWAGRVYAAGGRRPGAGRKRIRYGPWGSNLFQSVYDRSPSTPGVFPLMPEWYLLIAALAVIAVYDGLRDPILEVPVISVPVTLILFAVSVGALAIQALRAGSAAAHARPISERGGAGVTILAAAMYLSQPLARLAGRLPLGLTPWRRRGASRLGALRPRTITVWSTSWRSVQARLAEIDTALRLHCMGVVSGGDYDRWDIQVRVGPLAAARLRLAAEEHGQGKQLVRMRVWPRPSRGLCALLVFLAAICALVIVMGDALSAVLLGVATVLLALRAAGEHAGAMTAIHDAFARHMLDESAELHPLEEPVREPTPLSTDPAPSGGRPADEQATPFRSRSDPRTEWR
jgi:GT2 family glycosyltransferase